MSKLKEKRIEISITHINYDSEKMKVVVEKYLKGIPFVKEIVTEKKGFWVVNLGVSVAKFFDGIVSFFNKRIKVKEVEVYDYLEKCEIKKVDSDLELKLELKNVDISKLVNEHILPKTKDNVFVYELLKLINDELDNEMKINCLKLVADIFNEKRIIPQYIDKISDQVEDLSGLNLKVGDIKVIGKKYHI